ncbi:serine carboxypeptidase-like [Impatiens glandulifera]|uniref:serine carboxypeptidase-like n=1 Tax=Impatiens glandulifera TaxID=253017 RepID=UPI001FB14F0D|nr:serine carboxypeptidase-like [Impatiens glandulifera]
MGLSSCLILFPLFFISFPILSSSSLKTSNVYNSPSNEAQRLIRSFNLFPSSGINSGGPSARLLPNAASSSLVEKQFTLPVLGDPGTPSIQNLGQHAGYYRLPHSKDARMFYFFFESRKNETDAPVVIWLSGGPGCSSSIALFYENGPFQITNNSSLIWNDFGWDQVSNLIYVDQPTGTGFSYSSDESSIRNDEEGVSNDLYDFLQAFFKEHPQYLKNDFYITGESYAGHYIPALATRVHNGNKNKEGALINLKGFAIGNGLTNPAVQYNAYPDYALRAKLITQSQYKDVASLIPTCEKDIAKCNVKIGGEGESCTEARSSCTAIFNSIMDYVGNKNYYDFRKECVGSLCYDFSNMEKLLNEPFVRKALGVGDIEFVSCSTSVYDALIKDWMRNLEGGIPALLEDGIKVLVYAGEYDIICNWLGNLRWVQGMKWSGQKNFIVAPTLLFEVDGAVKGKINGYGPLSFIKVHEAGHMVPMDQPKAALEMLERWTKGTLSMSKRSSQPIDSMSSY